MKVSLNTLLVFSYLVVILLGMGIITPLAWLAVEQLYLNNQKTNLLAQAQLAASVLQSSLEAIPSSAMPYSQTSNTAPGVHVRVLNPDGALVINLAQPVLLSEDHDISMPSIIQDSSDRLSTSDLLKRPEVNQALSGQAAVEERFLYNDPQKRVLYAAVPVMDENGGVVQIVYLATPMPDTRFSALPQEFRLLFVAVFSGAILMAVICGFLFARLVSQPLNRLAEVAQRVASGDLRQNIPETGGIKETVVLGSAFNRMTASLRRSEEAKNAFIANVTHELRTPLTVFKGTLETLQDGAIDDPEARDSFLQSMNRESERLIRLVNDLLILTRADAGVLNLNFQPVSLIELLENRCEVFKPLCEKNHIQLALQTGHQNIGMVNGDSDRLSQIVDNLLDNAIRYSPPGGKIMIDVEEEAEKVICRITDQGPGIPAQHLPYVFDRFYRVDAARDRQRGGSGLGLSIVASLVRAHQGEIEVSSMEGRGTTFKFRLNRLLY